MPRWELHLSFGLMAFIVLSGALFMGLRESARWTDLGRAVLPAAQILFFGGGALLVGSVLPDLDGKGRIRWIIGPVVGIMLLLPFISGRLITAGPGGSMELIKGEGSLLFLGGTAAAYFTLAIPLRHRGILHSPKAGILFGGVWGAYVWYFGSLDPFTSLLVGTFAGLGYFWHLALDGKLL